MTDERPESLAAQAASWVPPWERANRSPDAGYAAASRSAAGEDDDDARTEAGLSDDDDFDPAFEGPNPAEAETGVPPELPSFPEEAEGPPTVDAPQELPGDVEPEPTDIGAGPEVPMPEAIEEAAEHEIGTAPMVDAPLPPDGDDAGDVFDAAADDDVADAAELDLPVTELVPDPDEEEEDQPTEPPKTPTPSTNATAAPHLGDAAVADLDVAAGRDLDVAAGRDLGATAGSDLGDAAVADLGATAGPDLSDAAGRALGDGGEMSARDAAAAGAADADAALAGGALTGGAVADITSDPVSRVRPSSGIPAQGRRSKGDGVASGAASPRTGKEAGPGKKAGPGKEAEPKTEATPHPADEPADEPAGEIADEELRAALEAILLVVDEPVAEMQLAQIMEQPTERVAAMLEDISARYTAAGHGFDLRRAAGGWRLYTRPEYAAYVERFVLDGQSVRLTQAALETLAVVAYKQPVTRSRISAIRGVNCDGVMRTLNTRGLIEECGTESETGAFLYRTTALFLEKLGLNSVDQLPPLAPFLPDDVEEVLDASG
jgi:segregation and condensation protein B